MIHDLDHGALVEALSKGDRLAAENFVRKEIIELYDLIAEDILASGKYFGASTEGTVRTELGEASRRLNFTSWTALGIFFLQP